MCRKYNRPIIGNLVELVDKDGAEATQPVDHETVMDDLMAHEDWRPKPLERELDDLDRSVDACAKATRRRNQHPKGR